MKNKILYIVLLIVAVILVGFIVVYLVDINSPAFVGQNTATTTGSTSSPQATVEYRNTEYGFGFTLPVSWKGYTVIAGEWQGLRITDQGETPGETGPMISIRHPAWTQAVPRQDIPVMVFTLAQWSSLQNDEFHIGAAPIGPSELGRNAKYVFALPARYNYAFPVGFEEVDKIVTDKTVFHTF